MILVSLDPGEKTGWALFNVSLAQRPVLEGYGTWNTTTVKELFEWITSAPSTFNRDILCAEDFRIYKNKSEVHIGKRIIPIEILGAVDLYRYMLNLSPVERVPASKKLRWTDARLKYHGFFDVLHAKPIHAKDACLIGLAYMEEQNLWTP